MTNFSALPRVLRYPLDDVSDNTALFDSDEPLQYPFAWGSFDSDERIEITLELSLNEYIALASAVDVGADIAYSTQWLNVWRLLTNRIVAMPLCERINDCIDTNQTVQQTIINQVINNGTVNPNSINPETTTGADRFPNAATQTLRDLPSGCDKDMLWGGIREIVNRLDQNGRDILEDMAVINDRVQQVAEIVDLIPLLGDTIKDVSDLFTEQIPDILNAYNAASSPTFLDNVACDLFQLVCRECRYPTFDEVIDYLGDNSLLGIPSFNTLTYGVLWNLVKSIAITNSEAVWYTINVWQMITIALEGVFGQSYGKNTMNVWGSFGEEFANDNWLTLCGDCTVYFCYNTAFCDDLDGWNIISGNYPYSELNECGIGGGGGVSVVIEREINRYVTTVQVGIFGLGTNSTSTHMYLYNNGVLVGDQTIGDNDRTFTLNQDIGVLKITCSRTYGWGVDRVTIRGEGVNPFGKPDNCDLGT